jgi:hypothetical protein
MLLRQANELVDALIETRLRLSSCVIRENSKMMLHPTTLSS